jgi:hypothetical protein|tara:strand:- start:1629 stop:2072 length:444 start_codon:yes stop_codon:yes gene_type:complete
MARIDAHTIKEIQLFKYYRLVRKWACKTYNIKEADLELLMYLDSVKHFTRNDFIEGVHIYTWDKRRWERLRSDGWIDVWRQRNRTSMKYTIYKTSFKAQQLLMRIYRILLGEEDVPSSERNVYHKNKTYTEKVMNTAMEQMKNDPDR